MFEQEVDNSRKRKVGFSGFFQEKMVGAEMAGEEKTEKSSKRRGMRRNTQSRDNIDDVNNRGGRKISAKERIEERRAARKAAAESTASPTPARAGKANARGRNRKKKV